jgi:uncharacterized protein DUF4031
VDPAFECSVKAVPRAKWACHLTTDGTKEDLHRFAKSIGLRRFWFQDRPRLWHYDLIGLKARQNAVKAGAVDMDWEQAKSHIRRLGERHARLLEEEKAHANRSESA